MSDICVQDANYTCNLCSKTFSKRSYLVQHVRRNHKGSIFQCYYCEYSVKVKFDLVRHMKLHLRGFPKKTKLFTCVMCKSYVCNARKSMIEHYIEEHDAKVYEEEFTFGSIHEFEQWKSGVERTDVCRFIQNSGQTNRTGVRVLYFRCFRDGHFHSESKGFRRLKVKGSVKIDGICPASIKAVEDKVTGAVHVRFMNGHVGHCQDSKHLTRTRDKRTRKKDKRNLNSSSNSSIGTNLQESQVKKENLSKSENESDWLEGVIIEVVSTNANDINEKKMRIRNKVEEILEEVKCDEHFDIFWNALLPVRPMIQACSSTVATDITERWHSKTN